MKEPDSAPNIKEGLRIIWRRYLSPFKREIAILSGLGVLSAILNGLVPLVTGRFFDTLVAVSAEGPASASAGELAPWAALLLVWAIVQFFANNTDWLNDYLRRAIDTKLHLKIEVDGFLHLYRLPLAYHKNEHANAILQGMSRAGWRVASIFRTIVTVAPQLLSIVIGITLAMTINTALASILLVGVVLYSLLLVRIFRPAAEIDRAAHDDWSNAWDDAAQAVQQIESVKHATAEDHETKRSLHAFLEKTATSWMAVERIWSNASFFQRTIVFLTQLSVFVLAAGLVAKGELTVGELIALNGYALMFFGPLVQLGHSWQNIQNGITSAVAIEGMFTAAEEEYEPKGAQDLPSGPVSIEFANVVFRYAEEQPLVLDGVSFRVEPGEIVALVGESGVGKSTTVGLLSAYYFPTEGEVRWGGIDTRKLRLLDVRRRIAVVPQEIALFNDSIAANIRYGSFERDLADVKHAAEEAHIAEFIASLPSGYETEVGERGIKLSVGQKQRVAIARAILRDPEVLVLDEPTSALDAETERVVTEALERLMRGRTTFIIAHRLSTVRKADRILVFKKGKIVEIGKHDDLVKKEDGVYRRLYEYQIGLH